MIRTISAVATALAMLLASGCSATTPSAQAPSTATPTPSVPAPAPATSAAPTASATPTPTAEPTPTKPPADKRKGRQLARPYVVNGIIVVSKKHRISAAYAPADPTGPYRLEAVAAAALKKMTAAARKAGVRVVVRSGYRSFATQNASYQNAKRNWPQNIDYYAPAGASEHQTGLSLDLWDGVTWSLPMANTATGKWLHKHAHDYGFILRYPKGKKKITGYEYEPWHFRYIGVAHAKKFDKGNRLTLEEYLRLA